MFKYVLSDHEVNRLVEPAELVEFLRRLLSSEDVRVAERVSLEYMGSWYASMMAAGNGFFTTKLVGVYPGNERKGLPLVRAILIVVGGEDGEPVFLMDQYP